MVQVPEIILGFTRAELALVKQGLVCESAGIASTLSTMRKDHPDRLILESKHHAIVALIGRIAVKERGYGTERYSPL